MINKDQYSGFEKELAVRLIEDDLVDPMAFIRLMRKQSISYQVEMAVQKGAWRVRKGA
jgi:hypothetical protein